MYRPVQVCQFVSKAMTDTRLAACIIPHVPALMSFISREAYPVADPGEGPRGTRTPTLFFSEIAHFL